MAYEKIHDLLNLAIFMQSNREGVSLAEISQIYNVSRRTAERMRDMLLSQFPQTEEIIEGSSKRWYIPQGTLNNLIQFSAEEIAVLETAKKALEKENLPTKASLLEGVSNKIKASIKPQTYNRIAPDAEALMEANGFVFKPGPKAKIEENILKQLNEAILACKRVEIIYWNQYGATSKHVVEPYGFLYGNNQYLVANFCNKQKYRLYTLSAITEIRILGTYFEKDKDFSLEKYTEKSFGVFQEEPFEVEWLFNQKVAKNAKQYIFHSSQSITEHEDGSLTVKFRAGGKLEMLWHLYTWGNNVTVIKPIDWDPQKIIKDNSF